MIPHSQLVQSIGAFVADAEIDVDESLDISAAALEAEDPLLERARLVSRSYVHGRHRRWVAPAPDHGPDPIVVSLTLHQFAASSEAKLSLADLSEQLRAAAVAQLRSTGSALTASYTDDRGWPLACSSCCVGTMHILVAVSGPPGTDVTAIAQGVEAVQRNRGEPVR